MAGIWYCDPIQKQKQTWSAPRNLYTKFEVSSSYGFW